jgi:hypothetical protein
VELIILITGLAQWARMLWDTLPEPLAESVPDTALAGQSIFEHGNAVLQFEDVQGGPGVRRHGRFLACRTNASRRWIVTKSRRLSPRSNLLACRWLRELLGPW